MDSMDLEKERERHQLWVTEMGRELKVVEKLEHGFLGDLTGDGLTT